MNNKGDIKNWVLKQKNVSSTKETMKEIVLAINHLSQELENLTMRVRQMDESMFGGLIRSEAMINVLLRKELVEGPDFNESLEEIYIIRSKKTASKLLKNSKKKMMSVQLKL